MQRNEMHAASDSEPLEFFNELVAVEAQLLRANADNIEMPGVLGTSRPVGRGFEFVEMRELLIITFSNLLPAIAKSGSVADGSFERP